MDQCSLSKLQHLRSNDAARVTTSKAIATTIISVRQQEILIESSEKTMAKLDLAVRAVVMAIIIAKLELSIFVVAIIIIIMATITRDIAPMVMVVVRYFEWIKANIVDVVEIVVIVMVAVVFAVVADAAATAKLANKSIQVKQT